MAFHAQLAAVGRWGPGCSNTLEPIENSSADHQKHLTPWPTEGIW